MGHLARLPAAVAAVAAGGRPATRAVAGEGAAARRPVGTGGSPCGLRLGTARDVDDCGGRLWRVGRATGAGLFLSGAELPVFVRERGVVLDGGSALGPRASGPGRSVWGAVVVGTGAQAVDCYGAQPLMPASCGCHNAASPYAQFPWRQLRSAGLRRGRPLTRRRRPRLVGARFSNPCASALRAWCYSPRHLRTWKSGP